MKTINLNKNISIRNCIVNFRNSKIDDFSAFAEGYHLAAKLLCEKLLQQNNFADFEGYPIIFLYRHSLELYLKFFIYKSAILINYKNLQHLEWKLEGTHNLVYLSISVKNSLEKLFPNDKELRTMLDELCELCLQFDKIDKSSYSFRYPIDNKGEFSSKNHQSINMDSLFRTMESYLEILNNIQFGIQIETDNIFYVIKELDKIKNGE